MSPPLTNDFTKPAAPSPSFAKVIGFDVAPNGAQRLKIEVEWIDNCTHEDELNTVVTIRNLDGSAVTSQALYAGEHYDATGTGARRGVIVAPLGGPYQAAFHCSRFFTREVTPGEFATQSLASERFGFIPVEDNFAVPASNKPGKSQGKGGKV